MDGQVRMHLSFTTDQSIAKVRSTPNGQPLPMKPTGAIAAYYGVGGAWVVWPGYVLTIDPDLSLPSSESVGVAGNIMNILVQRLSAV
jgi:hypothetical protein